MDLSKLSEAELVDLRRRAKERIKELREQPEEPPVGSIISFTKYFQGHQPYHFAAIHAPSGWSVTGRGGMTNVSWQALLEFLTKDEKPQTAVFFRRLDTLVGPNVTVRPAVLPSVGRPRYSYSGHSDVCRPY